MNVWVDKVEAPRNGIEDAGRFKSRESFSYKSDGLREGWEESPLVAYDQLRQDYADELFARSRSRLSSQTSSCFDKNERSSKREREGRDGGVWSR